MAELSAAGDCCLLAGNAPSEPAAGCVGSLRGYAAARTNRRQDYPTAVCATVFRTIGELVRKRQKFLAELEHWTGIEAGQLASIREQLDAELETEQEPEQKGQGWSLASLLRTTSAYAAAGGAYAFAQTSQFSRDLGVIAAEGWRKFDDVPKPIKVALVTAVAGGTVVASPFLLAALSTTSIVSILATLGGGAIAVGGYGVAGGVAILIRNCLAGQSGCTLRFSREIRMFSSQRPENSK